MGLVLHGGGIVEHAPIHNLLRESIGVEFVLHESEEHAQLLKSEVEVVPVLKETLLNKSLYAFAHAGGDIVGDNRFLSSVDERSPVWLVFYCPN